MIFKIKNCVVFPPLSKLETFRYPGYSSPPTNINDDDPATSQEKINEPYWEEEPTLSDKLLTLDNDVPYARHSIVT